MLFDLLTPAQKQQLRRLRRSNVPGVVLELVALVNIAGLPLCELDGAEFFAGMCAITNALRGAGFVAESFEMKSDPICEDMMSRAGYAYALTMVMSLKPGAMIWFTCSGPAEST